MRRTPAELILGSGLIFFDTMDNHPPTNAGMCNKGLADAKAVDSPQPHTVVTSSLLLSRLRIRGREKEKRGRKCVVVVVVVVSFERAREREKEG